MAVLWDGLKVLVSIVLAIGGPLLTWWLAREKAERQEVKAGLEAVRSELTALKLDLAQHYAQKDDVKDSRREVMEAVKGLETKVDRIIDKLDSKADKKP